MGREAERKDPKYTPKSEFRTKAKEEPKNTLNDDLLFAAIRIVESCVLSPNSARKTITKVTKKVFQRSKFLQLPSN